jgi:cytochrome b561
MDMIAAQPGESRVTDERYNNVAIALHWLIALLVVINVILGFGHELVDRTTMRSMLFWHKSIGISVLLLTLVRLAWRLSHPVPPLPLHMPSWQKLAARASHWAFYILLLALPLFGWLLTSASPSNRPIPFYGLFDWPFIPWVHGLPKDEAKQLAGTFAEGHELLAWTALILVAIHVLAALVHIFRDKDKVGHHMLPFLRSPAGEGSAAADKA